ncbi:MAG: hypothetical protein ACYCT2_04010 [Thermoplasmataceae archaeon]
MENFRIAGGIRISRPTIIFLFTGVFLASLGILLNNEYARYVGLGLVMAASMLFLYYMTSSRNPGHVWIKWTSGASIAAMALSAVVNLNAIIAWNTPATFLALLFPIIYVLAERMELGFVRGMKNRLMMFQALIAWVSVTLAFIPAEFGTSYFHTVSMYASITLLFVMILLSMIFDPTFGPGRRRGKFQRFMRTGIIAAYFWLILGTSLFVVQVYVGSGFLDPATHSIALGFIGTFIIAHSPIIFPLVLKKRAMQERVSYLPLAMITVASAMRVFGDLISTVNVIGNWASYISGYVIVLAVIAFVYNIRRIMVALASGKTAKTASY